MRVGDFDYELPPDRIAQEPVRPRDAARLMWHRVGQDQTEHRNVRDLDQILEPGDLLVVNDTRVLSARLTGRRATGGAVELLLLEEPTGGLWRALVKPAARVRAGEQVELEGGRIAARFVERSESEGREWLVALSDPSGSGQDLVELLEEHGRMPLPPYIRRPAEADERRELDREAYQTVYAREPGAVAAPTAGLHFTHELLERLGRRGVARASVTLHVGEGTFRPVTVEEVDQHEMHAEAYTLPAATVEAVAHCRRNGGRVIAVGTTSARVLESCVDQTGELRGGQGWTRLFLTPGSDLRVIDGLLTNFHLPRSTLLMLVSALAGRERVLRLYEEAVAEGYRFYSYGDAMLLT